MKIAIIGYGIEGESNYRYWSKDSNNEITIIDEREPNKPVPKDVKTVIGPVALDELIGFDLVVRTASWSPHKIKTTAKIWSATNELFAKCPAPIIGVTGTKGKGTICSLIASIFEQSGKKVWLLGNIGVPALDYLPQIQSDDIVILELSSFQLWDLEKSPHIAVISLIEPEHLDIHNNFEEYLEAKTNIRLHQNQDDVCIYHPKNKWSEQIAKSNSEGRAMRYAIPDDGGVYVKDGDFCINEQKICSTDSLQLVGPHNLDNACAAITVAKLYKLSNEEIATGLEACKGLPHRIEFVRTVDGVDYYNDSFSSSVPATIAAIKSFTSPEILIIGGVDRGGDFDGIVKTVKNADNVKLIILIGDIRQKLAKIFIDAGLGNIIVVSEARDIKEVVQTARSNARSGDVVILTPGCASFDMFENFYDRGDKFKREVKVL
jgi:UDP-N-acetylmuramoylalanine--D-glutamate ligase